MSKPKEKITKLEIKEGELTENVLVTKHPTSYIESLIHFIKGSTGSGIFAMSYGFKNVGLFVAPIITVVLGLFCLYGEHILLHSSRILKEKKKLSNYPPFAETIELGFENGPRCFRIFSKYMKPIVNVFIVMTHLGYCCVYFIFISSTSKQIMELFGFDFNIRLHMVIFLLPITTLSLIRELKYLVPLSLLANLCFVFGISAIIYIIGFNLPPISTRPYIGDWKNIPLFFGTVMYSFEGIGLVLPLKMDMKNPQHFDSPLGVLNVGLLIVMTIDTLFGFIGYLKFGEEIKQSITLNLDPHSQLSIGVNIAIAVGQLVTYLLMIFVIMLATWPTFYKKFGPFKYPVLAELLLRIGFVILTFILAEVIPRLDLFISLMGAFSTTALAMVVPPLCDISLRWPSDFGRFKWRFICDIVTLFLAIFGFLTGTYYSIVQIFEAFIEQN